MEEQEAAGLSGALRSDPEPLPLQPPVAVVGVGPARGSRNFLIGSVVALLLLGAFALFGYLAIARFAASFGQGVATGAALAERAHTEYPGTVQAGMQTIGATGTPDSRGPTRSVYITRTDPRNGGFRFVVVYSASSATTDAAAFENLDEFFKASVSPSQPTTSFMSMWNRTHAKDVCDYVAELGDSNDATRTYEVGYTPPANKASGSGAGPTYFAYSPATDSWIESAVEPLAIAPSDATAPAVEESVPDTVTAVAKALPAFEVAGAAQEPDGLWLTIVRHKRFHGVRLSVQAEYLEPGDLSDGDIAMFGRTSTRATAFAKMWAARHPGTIIESIAFDPDFAGDDRLVEVNYSPGSDADFGVWTRVRSLRFRYRPPSVEWVPVK